MNRLRVVLVALIGTALLVGVLSLSSNSFGLRTTKAPTSTSPPSGSGSECGATFTYDGKPVKAYSCGPTKPQQTNDNLCSTIPAPVTTAPDHEWRGPGTEDAWSCYPMLPNPTTTVP